MSIDTVLTQLSQQTSNYSKSLENKITETEINDPEAMLQAQFAIQKYASLVNYQSALIKTVRDMISGIISKIN
ncbi:type III secretion system needle filament subunit SctF [Providencia sp. Me31A]|uniref:type III secretion system needle filament subunit SctF n=1 Tax=Providencia sp. Me31A TaxID=3392637 RepID=UPI003D28E9D3